MTLVGTLFLLSMSILWWIFRKRIARRQYFIITQNMGSLGKLVFRITWTVDPDHPTESDAIRIRLLERIGIAASALMFAAGIALVVSVVVLGHDWTARR